MKKMIPCHMLAAVIFFILTGCASNPTASSLIQSMKSNTNIDTPVTAIKKIPTLLNPNTDTEKFSFDKSSPVLTYNDTVSYYRLYELDSGTSSNTQIKINSFCSCFGFDKRMMIPIVIAFDANGKEVDLGEPLYKTHQAAGITPVHITLTTNLKPGTASPVKIIVLADNAEQDKLAHSMSMRNSYGTEVYRLGIYSYPIGNFNVDVSTAR